MVRSPEFAGGKFRRRRAFNEGALRLLAGVVLVLIVNSLTGSTPALLTAHHAAPCGWPKVMAWTWDRPEDLRFLPPGVGVAAVLAHIEIDDRGAHLRPGSGTVRARSDVTLLPVVHVDAFPRWHPRFDAGAESVLVGALTTMARSSHPHAVQLDFEALPSQRAFLRRVLDRTRAAVPDAWLSVTALASWCLDVHELDDWPVDEVVAMAFRMTPHADTVRARIDRLPRWPVAACDASGIAADEPVHLPKVHGRLYLFSPRPWTSERWRATLQRSASAPFSFQSPFPSLDSR
jgi:hypothetical protein